MNLQTLKNISVSDIKAYTKLNSLSWNMIRIKAES